MAVTTRLIAIGVSLANPVMVGWERGEVGQQRGGIGKANDSRFGTQTGDVVGTRDDNVFAAGGRE